MTLPLTPQEIARALEKEAALADRPGQMDRLERLAAAVRALEAHMAVCVTHGLTLEQHRIGDNVYGGCDG